MYRWWHFLAESAARALPFPTSQRPTCPFSFTPGGTPPVRPSAASVAAGCEPFSPNRLIPAPCNSGSGPGTMAAGAREQAASCDAFVLSRRLPAPDAPPIRTSPLCLIAKPFPEPSPTHGPVFGRDCRREFRQARSGTPAPEGVLAVVGMTDGVWWGGSVMSTLRRGPCRPPVVTEADGKLRATPVVTALKL